jgi:hypothetical protein
MGHLKEVNLGYFEHMKGAFSLAKSCAYATLVLVAHGIFPDWGGTTGTDTLKAALAELEKSQEKEQRRKE